ncbi:MAG: hypothetical protein EPN37_18530 [Chitinophagaceae bacterium]|nr:MAG: hypothetical protein EPN37_18530 [Chitinophagaceae bacterium]
MKKARFICFLAAISCSLLITASSSYAAAQQDTSGVIIPIYLQYWHDLISQEQSKALGMAEKLNRHNQGSDDPPAGYVQIKDVLKRDIDNYRLAIEASDLDHRHKVLYLNSIYVMLKIMNREWGNGDLSPALIPELVTNFHEMLNADRQGGSIAPFVKKVPYEIGAININVFSQNYGYQEARIALLRKYAAQYPKSFLTVLNQSYPDLANEPFVDTVVARIAHAYPELVYNYATSYTMVGRVVRRNSDPLVQAIVKVGATPDKAIRVFPFIDYIVSGKYTVPQLQKIAQDDDAYYLLAVNTLIDMNRGIIDGEDFVGQPAMEASVKRSALEYIRQVNELHESPDPVRFACANKLTPQEIYYILVNGQQEIYTSSFVGLFKRFMQRMDPPRGDKLLMSVIFDRFRKFITLSSAYNTLDPFLGSMSQQNANVLMNKFVDGLQYTKGLAASVDVADAFGSIKDSALLKKLQAEVNRNFEEMVAQNDERGKVLYGLLSTLFNTRESSDQDEVWAKTMSQKFDLPPIDYLPFKNLINDSAGRVYEEVFFYGDKDGFDSYAHFMPTFQNGDWRVNDINKYFLTITSTKGRPVTLFVKKPISDPDEDEKAMTVLQEYLTKNSIHPTVFIHRGHSYHVDATLKELQPSAELVFLGSCGGYNTLAQVLNISPNAQIISSKQTGSMLVNDPIIRTIEDQIRIGNDLKWEKIWNQLNNYFKNSPEFYDYFQDYIPPQKNMGAIFIKAYKKLMKGAKIETEDE